MTVVVPTLPEMFEDAFERAGLRMSSGYDVRTARRSLHMLLLEWQNRGYNAFMVETGSTTLTSGTSTVTMPASTVDVIEMMVRTGTGTSQTDYTVTRISVSDYAKTSNKASSGRPTQAWVSRTSAGVTVNLWPVPDDNYTFFYYVLAAVDGVTSGIGGAADIPPRFVPALTAGLAFHIAMKRPETGDRAIGLRDEYETQLRLAMEADDDTFTTYIIPAYGAR